MSQYKASVALVIRDDGKTLTVESAFAADNGVSDCAQPLGGNTFLAELQGWQEHAQTLEEARDRALLVAARFPGVVRVLRSFDRARLHHVQAEQLRRDQCECWVRRAHVRGIEQPWHYAPFGDPATISCSAKVPSRDYEAVRRGTVEHPVCTSCLMVLTCRDNYRALATAILSTNRETLAIQKARELVTLETSLTIETGLCIVCWRLFREVEGHDAKACAARAESTP